MFQNSTAVQNASEDKYPEDAFEEWERRLFEVHDFTEVSECNEAASSEVLAAVDAAEVALAEAVAPGVADSSVRAAVAVIESAAATLTQPEPVSEPATLSMKEQIREGLERNEFYLVYQPQICLETGLVLGVEALLRWRKADGTQVMPDEFIPVAEVSGLILTLGDWVLRTACNEIVEMQRRSGHAIRLSVNLAPQQLHASNYIQTVQTALRDSGLRPEHLELELTERSMIGDDQEITELVHDIQALGVSVAIDDFGTGFCNLEYLNRFRVNCLKIDRSFVKRCTADHSSRMITNSIVYLAKSLGIRIVAEGVETEEQAAILRELKCEEAQGFLYSRPVPLIEVEALAAAMRGTPLNGDMAAPAAVVADALLLNPEHAFNSTHVQNCGAGRTLVMDRLAASSDLSYSDQPVIARDPICRPQYPSRHPRAARVRFQMLEAD